MEIRQLVPGDLPEVLRIQEEAYLPQLLESRECFAAKMDLCADGSLGCFAAGRMCGYIFCHPWTAGRVVPLDHRLLQLPPDPDCFYIHDLAVAQGYRGKGVGKRLAQEVFGLADRLGLGHLMLVAVQGSQDFWHKFGFKDIDRLDYAADVPGTVMTLSPDNSAKKRQETC